MRCSMKSVPPNLVAPIKMVRQGVEISLLGQGMMEGSIEYRDLRNIFSEQIAGGQDTFHVIRIVQRCKINAVFNPLQHAVVDQGRFFEQLSAMDYAMSDGVNVRRALDL